MIFKTMRLDEVPGEVIVDSEGGWRSESGPTGV